VKIVQVAVVAAVLGMGACAGNSAPEPSPVPEAPSERCGHDVQAELDPGLESRTVIAGPVAMVPSRVTPVPSGVSPARNFKLSVRLVTGADATLRTTTEGTALLFDRERARRDNVYRLADGVESVRFTGCPDRSAVFVGAVLTTGPRTVQADVIAEGIRTPVTLTAFGEEPPTG
jgi:hypothetical protein